MKGRDKAEQTYRGNTERVREREKREGRGRWEEEEEKKRYESDSIVMTAASFNPLIDNKVDVHTSNPSAASRPTNPSQLSLLLTYLIPFSSSSPFFSVSIARAGA